MMTRSYNVESFSLRVVLPLTGGVDVVFPARDFLFTEGEVHQLAMNEVRRARQLFACRHDLDTLSHVYRTIC